MAVNYTTLFTELGKIVKSANQFVLPALPGASGGVPSYPDLLNEIKTTFGTNTSQAIEGIDSEFDALRDSSSAAASSMSNRVDTRLLHKETVLEQLQKGELNIIDLLREIYRDMELTAQTIERRICNVGDPGTTPYGANKAASSDSIGTGTLSGSLILDGATPPSPGWPLNRFYQNPNYPTQLTLSELVTHKERIVVTCTADESSGTAEGQELFLATSDPAGSNEYDWRAYLLDRGAGTDVLGNPGSQASAQMSTVQAGQALANMGFESWVNTNEPESWTIRSGTPGTNILQEAAAVNVHRGATALALASAAEIFQPIIPGTLQALKRYLFGFWFKADSVTMGTLNMTFVSPSGAWTAPTPSPQVPPHNGTTATEGGTISLDLTGLGTTGWAWAEGWINMPAVVPNDLQAELTLAGGNGTIYVDSMGLGPVTYVGGVGYAITANQVPFLINDRFVTNNAVTNDATDGVFQKFFHRRYHQQLPSDPSSPSIPDSLAT